ncbi:MAG: tRNA (adenosine(37)-N6)-dimethylallyltransferase MiaA [Candidatus Peribacteraceae bacterium]
MNADSHHPSTTLRVTPSFEIVNADSRQLYKYMDIGTAKINPDEMRGVTHHLLDVLDPKEEVTAAWYKERATKAIDEVLERGNIPLLVGGSMLYISAVIDDLQFVPSPDPAIRKRLDEEYDRDGGAALYAKLQRQDPETAERFSVRNKPYVIRAIEILETIGTPSSVKRKGDSPYDLLIFGMEWEREELVKRIKARTRQLFEKGWIDEVQRLLERGYSVDDPGMRSQGYRDIAEVLANGKPKIDNGELLDALIESISAQARQYAKRQMTWWRRDPRIKWIPSKN